MSNNERYNNQFNDAMELIFDDPGRKSYPRTQNLMDALCVQISENGDMQDDGRTVQDGLTELDKITDNFLLITLKTAIVTMGALESYKGMIIRQMRKRLLNELQDNKDKEQFVDGLIEGMMKGEYCIHEIDRDKFKRFDTCPECHKVIYRPYKEGLDE